MPEPSPLAEHVIDLLADWGVVEARPRNGGWALVREDLVFALLAHETLYLKVDDENRERFQAAGGHPFALGGGSGNAYALSFWTPPDAALDDPDELADWAQSGLDAAHRTAPREPR